jgi:hypothetical protein
MPMRRLFLTAVLLGLLGCKTFTNPFENRPVQRVDDPVLPTSEQMRRGRDRLPLPDPTHTILPRTYSEFPDPHGL